MRKRKMTSINVTIVSKTYELSMRNRRRGSIVVSMSMSSVQRKN